ncbi:DUF397 domain-containing protein [Streptomyces sp. Je 1-79]|uniref:DUF397 domain-containing protein n=1 Tax=Streptomyces sp. Je 1-79 TaxID=2943847 RepID=UPI0021A7726F|nr:DUF397 domain-containing protein [Streptomyces sp. Je 1-79]MCT4356067.1 DUF397 domain-containing protein [Streptomyces sp. Je 1-79]
MLGTPPGPHDNGWFKSSYSGGNTTECVECACTAHAALVRDSKYLDGPVLTFGARAWRAFVVGVTSSR